jgi:hypothetical protein
MVKQRTFASLAWSTRGTGPLRGPQVIAEAFGNNAGLLSSQG